MVILPLMARNPSCKAVSLIPSNETPSVVAKQILERYSIEYSILKNLHTIAKHAIPHSIESCCLIKGKLLITFFLFLLH